MAEVQSKLAYRIGYGARATLGRIEVLALFPLIMLTADWFEFQNVPMITAFGLSGLLALALVLPTAPSGTGSAHEKLDGKVGLVAALDRVSQVEGRDSACLLIQIDDWPRLSNLWGHDSAQHIMGRVMDRLEAALRKGDYLCQMGDARLGIVLASMPAARLGLRETIASRLADAVGEPIPLNGTIVNLTSSIGHSGIRRAAADPAGATFRAAEAALSEAMLQGHGAIRAYADGMGRSRVAISSLAQDVEHAIHNAEISAWFQPQICTKTGTVTGMETLARWQHPERGLLGPAEFLPAVENAGQMALLSQSFIHHTLKSLADWDATGAHVPTVSINMSVTELQDPKLAEEFRAEVDRYDLSPDRVIIEITEELAAAHADDTITANLAALRSDGYRIDLDGVGAGAVPVLALQRFAINRIKIDHALVLGIENDPPKQQAVQAILALANVMNMQTIATGVETPQEIEALQKMGCDYLQGFGIARPLQGGDVADWVRAHAASGKTIRLDNRRAG